MDLFEYSGLDVHAVRGFGNRLASVQNTRNLTKVKPANAPQSGSGLDIGSISYEWQPSQSKAVSVSGMQVSIAPESRFHYTRIFIVEVKVAGVSLADTVQVLEQMKKVSHFIYTNGIVWRYYYNQKLKWEKNLGVSKTKYSISKITVDKNEFEQLRKDIQAIKWK